MPNQLLSKRFEAFAQESESTSPLYAFLSLTISKDADILALSSHAQQGQPVPNLLFAAVHYLLLQGRDDPLSEYYPSIVSNPKHATYSFESFKNFCNRYKDEIISILQTKLVQTNEVRRCAYLYPSFSYIYNLANKPLAL